MVFFRGAALCILLLFAVARVTRKPLVARSWHNTRALPRAEFALGRKAPTSDSSERADEREILCNRLSRAAIKRASLKKERDGGGGGREREKTTIVCDSKIRHPARGEVEFSASEICILEFTCRVKFQQISSSRQRLRYLVARRRSARVW